MRKKILTLILIIFLINVSTENVMAGAYWEYHVASTSITMVYAGQNSLDNIYSSGLALGIKNGIWMFLFNHDGGI